MAIEIVSVSKRASGLYSVTAQDTSDQIGVDENSKPIYRTYSAVHNPNNDPSVVKAAIANQIKKQKTKLADCDSVKLALQTEAAKIDAAEL